MRLLSFLTSFTFLPCPTVRRAFLIFLVFLPFFPFLPPALSQGLTVMTCIPVQQFAADRTQLECRSSAPEGEQLVLGELSFPFQVTTLIKVSSSYSAVVGALYPVGKAINDTVLFSALDFGDQKLQPRLRPIPLDSLSFLVETDKSLKILKEQVRQGTTVLGFLSPKPNDPGEYDYKTINIPHALAFDGSLVLEGITQYSSIGILQFLRLGLACYDKTPQVCLANIIGNL